MANYEEQKLNAMGLLKAGKSGKEVSRELQVPYPKVLEWKRETDLLDDKHDLEDVLDADKAILHELAEGVRHKLEELVPEGGDLVTATLERVDKLGELQVDLQGAGIKLIGKVNSLVSKCSNPEDILKLVDAVAKLQTAFFSKGANVNVLNMPGNGQPSDSNISAFKSLQRSA